MLKEHLTSEKQLAAQVCYEVKDGDKVTPFHFLDKDPEYQSCVALLSLRFDAVLDTKRMREALEQVFQLEQWQPLGARIRRNKEGKLEHHIPAQYDEERAAFTWSVEHHNTCISDHVIASKIPASGSRSVPTMYTDIEDWKLFLYPKDRLPWKLEHFLEKDISPISIQIHAFDDATLLTLGFHHCVLDAIGGSHLFQTWAAILANKRGDIKPFRAECERDVVQDIIDSGRTQPEKYLFHDRRLKGLSLVLFFLSLIWEWLLYRAQDWRTICLPASFVSDLKTQAIAEVDGEFLSEGDVLSAWRNRLIANALKLKPDKNVLMLQYYTLYGVLDELPAGKAHTGNSIAKMFAMMTVEEMLNNSLGKVALRVRKGLSQQRTRKQAEAFLSLQAKHSVMLFGPGSQIMMGTSNMSRAGLFKVDFSSVVLPTSDIDEKDGDSSYSSGSETTNFEGGNSGKGTPACVHTDFYVGVPFSLRNVGPIIGKDADGNWWLSWVMRSSAWNEVEKELARTGGVKVL
ncbi:putative transferase [Septoria linicola]|nr:putative transferase [Septoria linicola]